MQTIQWFVLVLCLAIALVVLPVQSARSARPQQKTKSEQQSKRAAKDRIPRDSNRSASREPTERSLERTSSRADFDKLARVYYRGQLYALPHVMFVIDRRDHDRVYYINSKAYQFHKDFINATYLSLERGRVFYENNYSNDRRRFLLGTVAYQASADKFTFEFWEGDRVTRELLAEAYAALSRSFFAPSFFKPNSLSQESIASALNSNAGAAQARMPILTASDLARDQQYQPLNLGANIGQLRILDRMTPDTVIDRNQIVIFNEAPIQLTPLSGIITTEPASPLSHVNMLAKSWAIPNAYIKNADKLFKQLEGKYVST